MGIAEGHLGGCLSGYKGSTTVSERRENISFTLGAKSTKENQNLGNVPSSL